MNKYSFFYDSGAEGGLSYISFETDDLDSAWEQWDDISEEHLQVRLVVYNLDIDTVLYQE